MVAVLVAGTLAACSSSKPKTTPTTTPTAAATTTPTTAATTTTGIPVGADPSAFYVPSDPLAPGPPGSLLRAEVVTGVAGVPAGATMWRILYRSRSIYDDDIAVSGYVVVPPGPVPAGGWDVVSWAHGTTGITPSCDPSMFRGRPYLLPDLADFLRAGHVVAATDYEGLGGLQPYLVGESEGRGVLDAARAAHQLPGVAVSPTTLIYGHSQGGHAALFAAEMAPSYAPDLRVVGVAAAAPATGLSLILAVAGTPTGQGALSFLIEAGWSWAHTYRDLPPTDLFTPAGVSLAPVLTAGCLLDTLTGIASRKVSGSDVFLPGLASSPVVGAHARLNDPGRVRTAAPILVVQGTADTTVPPALTDAYVDDMACPVGDSIDYLHVDGATHATIPQAAAPDVLAWMADRLAGRPPPTTCGAPGDARSITPSP